MPATPANTDGSGMLYMLDASDRSMLKQMITEARVRFQRGIDPDGDGIYVPAPDVLVIKIPAGGIPAFNTGTLELGKAECEVYKVEFTIPTSFHTAPSELQAMTPSGLTITKEWVYNIYPVAHYYNSGVVSYLRATLERGGKYLIEKPSYHYLAVAGADIAAGAAGSTLLKDSPGGTTLAIVSAWNDWMDGGLQVSNGKEGYVRYFELENKWRWVNAECE